MSKIDAIKKFKNKDIKQYLKMRKQFKIAIANIPNKILFGKDYENIS